MACPSGKICLFLTGKFCIELSNIIGCLNGGAQIRPQGGETVRELTHHLEEMYKALPKSQPDNDNVTAIYEDFLESSNSDKIKEHLHTTYHAVEKMNTALNIKW